MINHDCLIEERLSILSSLKWGDPLWTVPFHRLGLRTKQKRKEAGHEHSSPLFPDCGLIDPSCVILLLPWLPHCDLLHQGTMKQIKPFLPFFSCLCQLFCHSNKPSNWWDQKANVHTHAHNVSTGVYNSYILISKERNDPYTCQELTHK